jgi:hypothetical protein
MMCTLLLPIALGRILACYGPSNTLHPSMYCLRLNPMPLGRLIECMMFGKRSVSRKVILDCAWV